MTINDSVLRIDDVVFTRPKHMLLVDAIERLEKIQRRTPGAIDDLWIWDPDNKQETKYSDYFVQVTPEDLFCHEWGIALDSDPMNPECVLVSGGKAGVSWASLIEEGLIPFAHSHPYHNRRKINASGVPNSITTGGVCWKDVNGEHPQQKTIARLLIFPSAADAIFCRECKLTAHWVETPYLIQTINAHYSFVVNPPSDPTALDYMRLRFRISNALEIGPVPKKENYDRNSKFVHTKIDLAAFEGRTKFWEKKGINVTQIGAGGLDIA